MVQRGVPVQVAVIGSRGITDYGLLEAALSAAQADGLCIGVVLSGGARGVDRLGEAWATRHHVPLKLFHPYWDQHGRRAGVLRNIQMMGQAEAVVALHTGTPGTRHALGVARRRGLPIWEFTPEKGGVRTLARPPHEEDGGDGAI